MPLLPTVLLVDDEPQSLLGTHHALSWLLAGRYVVKPCLDPREALSCVRGDTSVRVVVAELAMTKLPGAELLRLVQAWRPDVGQIVLTRAAQPERLLGDHHDHVSWLLTKPSAPSTLARAVDDAARFRSDGMPSAAT